MDYTKGIPERFRAVDRLLDRHPELKTTFSFVQIGAPSRNIHIPAYRRLNEELNELADGINWRHATEGWQPIVFLNEHCGPEVIYLLIASPPPAGQLAARRNESRGQRICRHANRRSRRARVCPAPAGAARDLSDAVLINPFAIDELAEALRLALTMTPEEQEQRMTRMRQRVTDNNVYRWAGMLLSEASKLVQARQMAETRSSG